jgi:hypothetical protein
MVSNRCKLAVRSELKRLGLHFVFVDLGVVEIMENITSEKRELLKSNLLDAGFELMDDKKAILIEKIKTTIIEMVHHTEESLKVNFSDFLSEKLSHNYTYLANLFSEVQGTTIEHFIILHKVERIKELIIYDEHNICIVNYYLLVEPHSMKYFGSYQGLSSILFLDTFLLEIQKRQNSNYVQLLFVILNLLRYYFQNYSNLL